jgi:hypothetical protein
MQHVQYIAQRIKADNYRNLLLSITIDDNRGRARNQNSTKLNVPTFAHTAPVIFGRYYPTLIFLIFLVTPRT